MKLAMRTEAEVREALRVLVAEAGRIKSARPNDLPAIAQWCGMPRWVLGENPPQDQHLEELRRRHPTPPTASAPSSATGPTG